jgi:hypothetical protein
MRKLGSPKSYCNLPDRLAGALLKVKLAKMYEVSSKGRSRSRSGRSKSPHQPLACLRALRRTSESIYKEVPLMYLLFDLKGLAVFSCVCLCLYNAATRLGGKHGRRKTRFSSNQEKRSTCAMFASQDPLKQPLHQSGLRNICKNNVCRTCQPASEGDI